MKDIALKSLKDKFQNTWGGKFF